MQLVSSLGRGTGLVHGFILDQRRCLATVNKTETELLGESEELDEWSGLEKATSSQVASSVQGKSDSV